MDSTFPTNHGLRTLVSIKLNVVENKRAAARCPDRMIDTNTCLHPWITSERAVQRRRQRF